MLEEGAGKRCSQCALQSDFQVLHRSDVGGEKVLRVVCLCVSGSERKVKSIRYLSKDLTENSDFSGNRRAKSSGSANLTAMQRARSLGDGSAEFKKTVWDWKTGACKFQLDLFPFTTQSFVSVDYLLSAWPLSTPISAGNVPNFVFGLCFLFACFSAT